jgi:hypothetical protein
MPVNSENIYSGTYAKDCNYHSRLIFSLLEEGSKNPNTSFKFTVRKVLELETGEQVKEVK